MSITCCDNKPLPLSHQTCIRAEILPVFEELKLVLIGSHGVGKNSIGNAILRKKVFTYWKVRKHADIKETRTVSRRRIHLTRTPGWKEDWNNPEKTKNDIFHCVMSIPFTKPHAVLLTLKVNSKLSEFTISTLENRLTAQLWDHTIVLFTHRKKLDCTIEDYIIRHSFNLYDKCGQRYFVIHKNYSQITDTIEELIAQKNLPGCFEPHNQKKDDNIILSELQVLVTRIKSKISSILTYKDNLKNAQNKALLDSKDKEIERLNTIVEEKEREIKRLQSLSTQDRPDLSALCRITELEDQLCMKNNELKEVKHENVTLKKENVTLKKENEELKEELQMHQHAGYRNKLCQDVKQKSMTKKTQIQLHDLSSKGSALNNWNETLLKILEMLKDYEMKKLKFFLNNDEEFTISIDSIVDSVDLANAIKNQWDKERAVLKLRDFIKKIPRNDDKMIQLFAPFLQEIGETW
ncbi:LOW QUALITY PROTEIN: structural maintenance of chromosomes protein 2-like [Megalobrama amblycephala]|uniref:LOW QUALITY PROTEIN: structural maintenance of chromosomes protein 2-like n=1 Tax=Megalobrama amblycephala TaxID=75352 RepID=UPI0020141C23|nr:LOW QUALITY PROTEIN: structural maintenance of chromosomes protein 2-like [Megalobrama amblycephala]